MQSSTYQVDDHSHFCIHLKYLNWRIDIENGSQVKWYMYNSLNALPQQLLICMGVILDLYNLRSIISESMLRSGVSHQTVCLSPSACSSLFLFMYTAHVRVYSMISNQTLLQRFYNIKLCCIYACSSCTILSKYTVCYQTTQAAIRWTIVASTPKSIRLIAVNMQMCDIGYM